VHLSALSHRCLPLLYRYLQWYSIPPQTSSFECTRRSCSQRMLGNPASVAVLFIHPSLHFFLHMRLPNEHAPFPNSMSLLPKTACCLSVSK
jgi:hypothetical protein